MRTLAERVSAFINTEGHHTQLDTSNENTAIVSFRSRGLTFTAQTSGSDERYLHIACAMSIEPGTIFDAPLSRALLSLQDRFKCIKYAINNENTLFVCSVESFFGEPDGYEATFWRNVSVIESAIHEGINEIFIKNAARVAAEQFIAELSHRELP